MVKQCALRHCRAERCQGHRQVHDCRPGRRRQTSGLLTKVPDRQDEAAQVDEAEVEDVVERLMGGQVAIQALQARSPGNVQTY